MLKEFTNVWDCKSGKLVEIYEDNGKLYVTDNFGFSSLTSIEKWLEVHKIFFGEDREYELVKKKKELFKKFKEDYKI